MVHRIRRSRCHSEGGAASYQRCTESVTIEALSATYTQDDIPLNVCIEDLKLSLTLTWRWSWSWRPVSGRNDPASLIQNKVAVRCGRIRCGCSQRTVVRWRGRQSIET